MTETLISSATKEVMLGFERPFVIIGERINPVTGSEPKGPLEILPLSHRQCAGLAAGTAPDRPCVWSLASEKLMMLGSKPRVSVGDQCHE